MFQLGTSYTTHVLELAEFIAKDPNLKGKRVGILVSDSQYIKPVANTFKKRLEELGQTVSAIVPNQKPAQNPDYNGYILQFRSNEHRGGRPADRSAHDAADRAALRRRRRLRLDLHVLRLRP